MKKYKLIQTYPGSPELNTLCLSNGFIFNKIKNKGFDGSRRLKNWETNHLTDTRYWEEIVEKDYEILSVINPLQNNCEIQENLENGYSFEYKLNKFPHLKIKSIKRLSDGQIFTIDDNTKYGCIDTFYIKNNYLMVTTVLESIGRHLKDIILIRKPLFTTDYEVTIWSNPNNPYEHSLIDRGGWNIQQVRRLSDNIQFKIGDYVKQKKNKHNTFTITGFKLDCNNEYILALGGNGGIRIDKLNLYKKILFTTKDGVDIFKGDKYFKVLPNNNYTLWDLKASNICATTNITTFSTKEKAEEYILMNKPCLYCLIETIKNNEKK